MAEERDPTLSEVLADKANHLGITYQDLVDKLDEATPTEITVTFGAISYIIKPSDKSFRQLYVSHIVALANNLITEKRHFLKLSEIEKAKEDKLKD